MLLGYNINLFRQKTKFTLEFDTLVKGEFYKYQSKEKRKGFKLFYLIRLVSYLICR